MIKRKRSILEVIPMTLFYMLRVFGSPIIIFIGIIAVWIDSRNTTETMMGIAIIIIGLSPHILAYALARSSRKKIRKILSSIKSSESFLPEPKYEFWEPHSEAYLGIDAKRGTFVYVRLIRRGQVDLIGFDMHNWVGIELDGRLLNIKTKTIEAPVLSMGTRG